MKKITLLALLLFFIGNTLFAQDDQDGDDSGSVIQTLTPSKLIPKGQFDLKWFNNLYTQTESTFTEGREARQTFFTSTLEVFAGVSENKRVNVGLVLEYRSNVIDDRYPFDVLLFDGERGTARSGLTAIAPSIRFVPIAKWSNFSIQSSISIPLFDNETEDGDGQDFMPVFLDQKGFTFQNRFFYDYTFPGNTWQIFAEINTEYDFGSDAQFDNFGNTVDGSFANDSLRLIPGVFVSYFPSSKFTIQGLVQHAERFDLGNNFEQDFTIVGGGAKYQLTKKLNIEFLYTNFVRGNNTGLGESYNLGARLLL